MSLSSPEVKGAQQASKTHSGPQALKYGTHVMHPYPDAKLQMLAFIVTFVLTTPSL